MKPRETRLVLFRRPFELSRMPGCLSPSRQTPLGGCGKHRLTNDALGILCPTASLASPIFLLLLLLLLLRRARRTLECANTLAVGQVTSRDPVSIILGRWPSLSQVPTDWPAPVDACSAQKACSPLLTALRQNRRSPVGGEGCIAHNNFR